MNDQEFLGYVEIHSETPRALFSRAHVERFLKLAGREDMLVGMSHAAVMSMHHDDIHDLIEAARQNVRATCQ